MQKTRLMLLVSALIMTSGVLPDAAKGLTFSTPRGASGSPRQETTGGATRTNGACLSHEAISEVASVTPLVPNTQIGLTVSARPTFFVYVPKSTAKEASFSLQDQSQNLIYRTKVAIPAEGGVVSITLPKTVTELQQNQDYKWVVEIHCLVDMDPDNPIVEGWVRRTAIDAGLAGKLEQAKTPLERAIAYSEAGIWYEALTNMVDARRTVQQNENVSKNWEEFLTSVGLKAIANQPLVR